MLAERKLLLSPAGDTSLSKFACRLEKQAGTVFSNDVIFPQVLYFLGVIAELAQPRVRVLGKGRSGPLRQGLVIGKSEAASSYFLFSSRSFIFGDEVAA